MLTKDDAQMIRDIVRGEIEAENENTRNEIQAEMKLSRMRIEEKIDTVEKRLKNIEVKVNRFKRILVA